MGVPVFVAITLATTYTLLLALQYMRHSPMSSSLLAYVFSEKDPAAYQFVLSRGAIINRTYGTHKKLYISLVLLTVFGPINYGPP